MIWLQRYNFLLTFANIKHEEMSEKRQGSIFLSSASWRIMAISTDAALRT